MPGNINLLFLSETGISSKLGKSTFMLLLVQESRSGVKLTRSMKANLSQKVFGGKSKKIFSRICQNILAQKLSEYLHVQYVPYVSSSH